MNISEKIELYFFDPWKDEDLYSKRYFEINPDDNIKSYSPLYLMRRQILLLSGQLIQFPSPPIWQIPYLSAILVSNIVIDGLVELLKLDRENFFNNYLSLDSIQYAGLRVWRNGLEHNNFQLYHRVYKIEDHNKKHYGKWEFLSIENFFKKNSFLDKDVELDYFKISFRLHGEKNSPREVIMPPVLNHIYADNTVSEDKYALITYDIWPFKFFIELERVIDKAKQIIIQDNELKNFFDESVTKGNWMQTYSI